MEIPNFGQMTYHPECLTIAISDACGMACRYCYAGQGTVDSSSDQSRVRALNRSDFLAAVRSAFSAMTELEDGRTPEHIAFGFQGNGEPFLEFDLMQQVTRMLEKICREKGIIPFAFITTNGTGQAEQYRWARRHFNRICFSMDGDAALHNTNRKMKDGSGSYGILCRNLELILKEEETNPFACRSTITDFNVTSMERMIDHLMGTWGFREVVFEPVYHATESSGLRPDARIFADHFLKAARRAESLGGRLMYTGYQVSGHPLPYCNLHKQVLHLDRSGHGNACMFRTRSHPEDPLVIGTFDQTHQRFQIHSNKVEELFQSSRRVTQICAACELLNGCSLGCPDLCPVNWKSHESLPDSIHQSLRCNINRLLHVNSKAGHV